MSRRLSKIFALAGVSAALAIGGAGVAQASPDHSGHHKGEHCKQLQGKKKRHCEQSHHNGRHR